MKEAGILESGLERLRTLVPADWKIGDYISPSVPDGIRGAGNPGSLGPDAKLIMMSDPRGGGGIGNVLVTARKELTPAQAQTVLAPQVELMRALTGEAAVLVIAPWLSTRTRAILEERGYGYLDLTGNALFRLRMPAVFVRDIGADRDPSPRRSIQGVSGPRAGRLVRLLAEFAPPYRATELAACADLSISYISRLLDALEEQALLRREGRFIMEVDWPNLLRERAERYNVLRSNEHLSFLAPSGVAGFLAQLKLDPSLSAELMITGSMAAAKIAQVTVGGQCMAYMCSDSLGVAENFADRAGLLPVGQGANVVLLLPQDRQTLSPYPDVSAMSTDGLLYAPRSQVVLDCLGGNGRMPAEGQAVLGELVKMQDRRPVGLPVNWKMA